MLGRPLTGDAMLCFASSHAGKLPPARLAPSGCQRSARARATPPPSRKVKGHPTASYRSPNSNPNPKGHPRGQLSLAPRLRFAGLTPTPTPTPDSARSGAKRSAPWTSQRADLPTAPTAHALLRGRALRFLCRCLGGGSRCGGATAWARWLTRHNPMFSSKAVGAGPGSCGRPATGPGRRRGVPCTRYRSPAFNRQRRGGSWWRDNWQIKKVKKHCIFQEVLR